VINIRYDDLLRNRPQINYIYYKLTLSSLQMNPIRSAGVSPTVVALIVLGCVSYIKPYRLLPVLLQLYWKKEQKMSTVESAYKELPLIRNFRLKETSA